MIIAVLGIANHEQPGPYREKWEEEMIKPWRKEPMAGEEWFAFDSLN